MRPLWPPPFLHRPHGERGVALVVAVAVVIVVVVLSTTAITNTMDTLNQSAVANKQVDSTDASEGGIQYELNQLDAAAASSAGTFSCPSSLAVTGSGRFQTTDTLAVYTSSGNVATPTTPVTGGNCSLAGNTTYLFESTGNTSANLPGQRTTEALVYVPSAVTYGTSGSFADALFADVDVLGDGSFKLTGGNTYSGSIGVCASNWSFGGSYYSSGAAVPSGLTGALPVSGDLPTTFDGACSVTGNLYMNNSLGMIVTGGSGVGGYLYSAGPVTVDGGAGVSEDIWSEGAVNLLAGAYGGNVWSGSALGGVTICTLLASCGTTVSGSIYSAGPVVIGGGTVTGNVYAAGPVTVSGGATVKGTIYSTGGFTDLNGSVATVENTGGTVSYTAGQKATGPLYETNSVNVPWLAYQGPTTTYSYLSGFPATCAATGPPSTPCIPSAATVSAYVGDEMISAANATNGTTSGTMPAVPWPSFTFDTDAWTTNDNGFCGLSGTSPIACTASTVRVVTNDDCNLSQTVDYQTVLDPNSVWSVIASMEQPGAEATVLQTDCQLVWGDSYLKGYSIPLYNSLAVFDTAGVSLDSSFSGFSSADGKTHQLYLVVPSPASPPAAMPVLGQPGANDLTPAQVALDPTDYPNGEASCDLVTGPDIDISGPLTDSGDHIEDFLYTPSSICSYTGNATIYGKVYAGVMVDTTSNWNLTYAGISPWAAESASGGAGAGGVQPPGTPVVQCVRQATSTAGDLTCSM